MPSRPTVVITGGTAGVGRAIARTFGRHGWNVAVLARGKTGLEATEKELRAMGAGALPIVTDMADADAVFAAADQVVEHWGGIDLWINNAMVTVYSTITSITPQEYARVTDVTYHGQVHGTMAALRHMRPRDRGTILQIGSALAYRAIPLQSAYCGAKAAVRAFTDALRSELYHQDSRIRVTMVHLPAVNTPQFDWARSHMDAWPRPVPPIHAPAAIAEAVYEAAHTLPREVWLGTPTVETILGNMIAPGYLDRMLAKTAWDSQEGPPIKEGRPDNLFAPVERDMGAEGRFSARLRDRVTAYRPDLARGGAIAAGIALAVGATLLASRAAHRLR